jgi:hypothetical protein
MEHALYLQRMEQNTIQLQVHKSRPSGKNKSKAIRVTGRGGP